MADEEDVSEDSDDGPIEMEPDNMEESDAENRETLVDVESARERLENAREGIELDRRHYIIAPALAVGAGLVVMLFFVALNGADVEEQPQQEPLNLTDYQENYVNCPRDLIDTCTKMSKIPTEEVTYWKTEDDWVYMKLGDGRAIISTKPNSTSEGSFVTYMSAEEVRDATDRPETQTDQSSTNSSA